MYYHVWFVTKYRKPTLVGNIERKAKNSFVEVVSNKNYNLLEMETNKDHAHLLLEANDTKELANMVKILKAVSAKKVLERTPHLRVGNIRHFWAKSFGYNTIFENQLEIVKEYIRNQKKIPHT